MERMPQQEQPKKVEGIKKPVLEQNSFEWSDYPSIDRMKFDGVHLDDKDRLFYAEEAVGELNAALKSLAQKIVKAFYDYHGPEARIESVRNEDGTLRPDPAFKGMEIAIERANNLLLKRPEIMRKLEAAKARVEKRTKL